MSGRRFARPASYYLTLFDAAQPTQDETKVEFALDLDEGETLLSLPLAGEAAQPEALRAARSILSQLAELDAAARTFLFARPGWPYGDDACLWLLIVEGDNARLCYHQESVNDEQVVGFRRKGDLWHLIGMDPRWRGK